MTTQTTLVIIESPYAGDVDKNVAYARRAMRDSLSRGECPIASHLIYTQPGILDDNNAFERRQGIEAGFAWWKHADLIAFYNDYGLSNGMQAAFERAKEQDKDIIFRKIGANP